MRKYKRVLVLNDVIYHKTDGADLVVVECHINSRPSILVFVKYWVF